MSSDDEGVWGARAREANIGINRGRNDARPLMGDYDDKSHRTASMRGGEIIQDVREAKALEENDHKLWRCIPIGCLPLRAQLVMQKQLTRDNGFVLLLVFLVIAFGTVNRVVYKIQLTPMAPYAIFISDTLSAAYVVLYFAIFFVRYWMGIITTDMLRLKELQIGKHTFRNPLVIDPKFIGIGFMDAAGQVIGIYAAREISGYLLTLLSQGMVPMTMILTIILLGARYNFGQVVGAAVLISGIVITLIPQMVDGEGGGEIYWAIVYFFSSAPNAVSFTLKEMIFAARPNTDIFVVNSFGSGFQLIFTVLFLPLVAIPGFGAVPFEDLGDYIAHGGRCFGGVDSTKDDDCTGMPWATLVYVCVNVSWNISILLLVKKGGAVLTFIALAVSLPLANLAFIFDWPLLKGSGTKGLVLDLVALGMVLLGLAIYRAFSIIQKRRMERRKALEAKRKAKAETEEEAGMLG